MFDGSDTSDVRLAHEHASSSSLPDTHWTTTDVYARAAQPGCPMPLTSIAWMLHVRPSCSPTCILQWFGHSDRRRRSLARARWIWAQCGLHVDANLFRSNSKASSRIGSSTWPQMAISWQFWRVTRRGANTAEDRRMEFIQVRGRRHRVRGP